MRDANPSVWNGRRKYGEMLYKRAIGELPEMECSKALADMFIGLAPNTILDVGCGPAHYLRSLKNNDLSPFTYTGVDATPYFLELARKAWEGVDFIEGDIYSLPFDDSSFDLVYSCNLFMHLPSIKTPLEELIRVAKKHVIVRTFIGTKSFRIKEVYSAETHPDWVEQNGEEFDEDGEPKEFLYYNIYSQSYIEKLLSKIPEVKNYRFIKDTFFDPDKIDGDNSYYDSCYDATKMIGGWQANTYILQPWSFIIVEKK